MADGKTLIHVTHETIGKVGGIGAVLQGLLTSKSYLNAIKRSITLGPLFQFDGPLQNRLGDDVEILYSSADNIANTKYAHHLSTIEHFYNIAIIYGKRTYYNPSTDIKSKPELLLFDIRNMNYEPVNFFKKQLYKNFGIRSDLYEYLWEYEQYIRTGAVAIEALKAIDAAGPSTTIIAHEFMGMPAALAGILQPKYNFKTIFYAHEVATIRYIVENHPGHDTMLYNLLNYCRKNNLYLNDIFSEQCNYFKHPLLEAAKYCDSIFAVGDCVADELRFLAPEFESVDINVIYNGIPAYNISIDEKIKSKQKLQQYCRNLIACKPDFIFTHVTRLVTSKGLWRDLQILEHIEKHLLPINKTAVMLLLSTQVAKRPTKDIRNMEAAYNWPVAHREGWPDLSGQEAELYTSIQQFNAKSRNIKIIFINQFGFDQSSCGKNMPPDMEFMDIRKASDVEFGLSIYEPFGISQLEPLTFGGICVVSSICGCIGLVKNTAGNQNIKNIIVADYTNFDGYKAETIDDFLNIGKPTISKIEQKISKEISQKICPLLTENQQDIDSRIKAGFTIANNMSWETVVENYILPSLEKLHEKAQKKLILTNSKQI